MVTLHEEIRTVQQSLNPNLKVRGYFLSLVPPRSRIQDTCRQLLVEAFGAERVFATTIPVMASFDTAINVRRPIVFHARRSRAAQVVRDFASELLGIPSLPHAHAEAAA